MIYLVMEYVETDLKELVKSSMLLSEEHVKMITYNLLRALQSIHSADVLHRDIKPANILVDDDCNIKLCDFGLARTIPNLSTHNHSKRASKRKLSSHVVTRWY